MGSSILSNVSTKANGRSKITRNMELFLLDKGWG